MAPRGFESHSVRQVWDIAILAKFVKEKPKELNLPTMWIYSGSNLGLHADYVQTGLGYHKL